MNGKKSAIIDGTAGEASGAKSAAATAERVAQVLNQMADPADDDATLNFGQMELLNFLFEYEEGRPGCTSFKKLSPALDAFRAVAAGRGRIAAYLASPMRLPTITPDYKFAASPVKRSVFAMSHGPK